MAQRVFDTNNEQDIQALFNIFPVQIIKICQPGPESKMSCVLIDGNNTRTYTNLVAIKWRDKKSVTRPNDETDWIGCLCWFWGRDEDKKKVGVLKNIEKNMADQAVYEVGEGSYFLHCRPVLRHEVKFVDDAAPGVSNMGTGGDIPNDKYLTITADDITIGGKSTTEYNGNDIWNRDYCMECVAEASKSFVNEHGASLEELHVVQANNVAGEPVPDAQGKFAWLRCVFNVNGERKLSRWVFLNAHGSVADCGSACADGCGSNVRGYSGFRAGVFGSVGD